MKKHLILLAAVLLLAVLFSCSTVSYYEVKSRYMVREGVTRYELPIPVSRYFTKWEVTFRADRSEAGTDYYIIVDYLGEDRLLLDTLEFKGEDLALEYEEINTRRINAPDKKFREWATFEVSRRVLDDIAYHPKVKMIVSGMRGDKEVEINQPLRDGLVRFLEATAPEEEKEEDKE